MNWPGWWPTGHDHEALMCPRRTEWDGPEDLYVSLPKHDHWVGHGSGRVCSWCGSLHPDVFMDLMRTGQADVGPTDKPYKAYVEMDDPTSGHRGGKFYFRHLSDEQREEFVALYNARSVRQYRLDLRGFDIVKVGTSSLRVSYPGYFYVLPYFMVARVGLQ